MTIDEKVPTAISQSPTVPGQWQLGQYYVPKGRYIDPDFLNLECERVFPRSWLIACREEEVADVGCFVEFEVAGQSMLIVRDESDHIKAYYNACRHRGTLLAEGRGRIGNIRCPFHAWQWNLDGTSTFVRDRGDFPELTDDYLRLRECQVDTWAGWVFLNLDSTAEPLSQYLNPLQERVAVFGIEDMRYSWFKSIILPCNWKTALDAFSEAYHLPGTHPQLIRPGDPSLRPASRKEIESDPSYGPSQALGKYVVRYRSESRSKDGENARYAKKEAWAAFIEYNLKELRGLYTAKDGLASQDLLKMDVPDGPVMFQTFRSLVREYALAEGIEWPEIPPSVTHHAEGFYTVFPNTVFLVRQGALLGYRSRPHGLDPNSCIFDIYALELFGSGKEPPFKPEHYEKWQEADVGGVLTQDFQNVHKVCSGMYSNEFRGAMLNPVQELGVFQRHVVIDDYIFGASAQS